jgi:hypothetical protein
MAKWLTVLAFALLALHFGEARATPSLTSLLSERDTDLTDMIGSKKKGSATTNSAQTPSATQKKKGAFHCPIWCSCGCFLGVCKVGCVPKAKSQ